jgi:thiol-disulfide isomerase/thioredoxin
MSNQQIPLPPTDPALTPRPRVSPALILFVVFPIVGLLAAAAVFLSNRSAGEAAPTPAPVILPQAGAQNLVNAAAPDFELRALDQNMVKLSDFRGRVVFLNFWATWCVPCEKEMPVFQEFAASQPDDGAVVVAVNIGETYDQVNAWLTERDISGFPILLDPRFAVRDQYGVFNLPTTFVIDREGKVIAPMFGAVTLENLNGYMEQLTEAT